MPDERYEPLPDWPAEQLQELLGSINDALRDRTNLENSGSRYELAGLARKLAGDRYSAGSSGAKIAVYVTAKFGVEAGINFAKDCEHHED